ncbi:MAG: CoA-binding protein [Chloroflexota bacterium]|nr:CoA-binding protein [Chloroflexota bacterium]
MSITKPIELFLKPRAVAIIGVPRRTGRGSLNVAEGLLQLRFRGQIYPVNPNMDSLLGLEVYPSVQSLPLGIDLGVVMVARQTVPQVIAEGTERGIKAFIVITEGFAEADDKGKALQSELVTIAKEKGARIIGPNSLGLINSFHNFSSSPITSQIKTNPIAFVCQSGGFLEGFSEFVPGKSIDLGNMCDINFAEMLEYLENDPEIKLIALHIEGLKDGKRFLQVATRVQQKKPVLVLKTGRGEKAAQAAASHTGSLSGKDEVYHAAFKQAGLIQVDNVDELGDITKAFLHLSPLKGNRVAVISPSGGATTLSLDAMERYGFELAKLSEMTINTIKEFFSAWSPPLNPIDVMAAGMRHGYKMVYRSSLEALLEDENVDAVLCIAGFPTLKTIKIAINGRNKPVVTWILGEWGEKLLSKVKETDYQTVYPSPDRAFRALSVLRNYISS